MPPKLSTTSDRKFNELLEDELNKLYCAEIADGTLKGDLVMLRNDQKGKEFDLGLRYCTSYDAPCSLCKSMADSGFKPFTKVSVGGYRKFLPANHPYRRDPRFGHPVLGPSQKNKKSGRSTNRIGCRESITLLPGTRGLHTSDSPLQHSITHRDIALYL